MSERHAALTSLPPILPRLIRRFAVVIVLLWLGFTAFVNLAVPQLEVVGKAHSVSMSPSDAASIRRSSALVRCSVSLIPITR